jgi:hypothetical protein
VTDEGGEGGYIEAEMDCLVIGGVADGCLIRIQLGAERIELGRPTHIKPLESPYQQQPEEVRETDQYDVCAIYLPTSTNQVLPFGLAVVKGNDPAWAMKQMTVAYVQYATDQLISNNSTKQ